MSLPAKGLLACTSVSWVAFQSMRVVDFSGVNRSEKSSKQKTRATGAEVAIQLCAGDGACLVIHALGGEHGDAEVEVWWTGATGVAQAAARFASLVVLTDANDVVGSVKSIAIGACGPHRRLDFVVIRQTWSKAVVQTVCREPHRPALKV